MITNETKLLSVRTAVIIFLLMNIAPIYFLLNIKFDNTPDHFAPDDSEIITIQKSIREKFPEDKVLIALFSGEGLYGDVFLQNMENLAAELQNNKKVEHVMGITSNDHIFSTDDGFEVEYLLRLKEIKHLTIAQRIERITSDRFAPGRIVSTDGKYTALIIRPHSIEDSFTSIYLIGETSRLITKHNLDENFDGFSGTLVVDKAMQELTYETNAFFVPITVTIGLILLWLMFRRKFPMLLSLLSIGAATNVSLLYLAFSDTPFSMPVAMVAPLIIALSTAFMIHLLNARLEAEKAATNEIDKMLYAVNEVKRPIFYTMLTTVLGLLSLTFSPVPPIQNFGVAAAIGIFLLYFITLYLQPALLAKWSPGNWRSHQNGMMWIDVGIRKLSRFGIKHAGIATTMMVVVIVGGIYFASLVKTETDFLMYFPDGHEVVTSTERVERVLSGTTPMEVLFTTENRDALTDPEKLKIIKKVQNWANSHKMVDLTASMPDVIEEFNWAFHDENPKFRSIPDNRNLISQYLFIYDGKDLYDMVDSEFQQTRLILNLNVHGTTNMKLFIKDLDQYLTKTVPDSMKWQIAGLGKLQADIVDFVITGQFYSGIGAVLLIFTVMIILWRSVPAAILCLLPNIAPLVFIFAMMGILGITLDIGTAIITSVALGIAVDDTIHIYDGYHKRVQQGDRPIAALARSYRINGRAITATTIILCAQYFVLATSDFIPTYQFGLMTGIGLLAALVFDIILLPALLALNLKRSS